MPLAYPARFGARMIPLGGEGGKSAKGGKSAGGRRKYLRINHTGTLARGNNSNQL